MKLSTTLSIIVIAIIIIGAGAYVTSHRTDDEMGTIQATPSPAITQSGAPFIQTAPSTSPDVVVATPTPSSAADTMAEQNPTVSMTDTGISPTAITVKAGTTVTFKNTGTTPHWPASDPHPIHTDLSGFDAKRGLESGDFYRFTFTKVGTFGMHDHLHQSFRATITVQ